MSGRRLSVLVLALALAGLAGSGYVAARRVGRQREVSQICDATTRSAWAEALAHGEGAAGADAEGRIAAECLCWAYAASERLGDCAALLDRITGSPGGADWVSDVTLARMLMRHYLDQGRFADAAGLARRAAARYPRDASLPDLELMARSALEPEAEVLADMRSRIAADVDESLALRVAVAAGYERRGEFETALAVLGNDPPDIGEEPLRAWFEMRAAQLGALNRADELRANYERWRALGGDEYEVRARYAIRLSQFGLLDPHASMAELLWQAIRDEDKLHDRELQRTLYERLLGRLLVDGQVDQALEVYDRASRTFDNVLVSREEILRTARAGTRAPTKGRQAGEPNRVVFRLPPDAPAGSVWLSAPLDRPPDDPYQRLELAPGAEASARRAPGPFPFRWVFRDAEGRTRASGSTWADLPETIIDIQPRPARAHQPVELRQKPGDGRRRVFVLILDCADWRLIEYLRMRGDLPVHGLLLERGHRAVLLSRPAFTGAAMEALVWPARGRQVTFVGLMNRLGLELAGLADVGDNPLAFLDPLLPDSESLFDRIGAGPHTALNLLFTHGHVRAGRHAELVGPHGQRRQLSHIRALRPLRADEGADLPPGLQVPKYRAEVHKMAAELDAAVELARGSEVDALLLRVEPLDLITHGFFPEIARPAQDDGRGALFWAYRYLDARLREVYEALDADDILIAMSDHGIRTALEHDEAAFFVAVGAGVPHGRAGGSPHLRGLPRVVADLLGVEADWPDTGIAPWARPASAAEGGRQRASGPLVRWREGERR